MGNLQQEKGIFHWGQFALDPVRRSLLRDGVRIKLAERLLDVLLFLVANHGRVVERDELLQQVWAGRTVEDNNVSQAIFELRKVLKTEGVEHSIITVPGRGFRFAEPVLFELEAPADTGAEPPSQAELPAAPWTTAPTPSWRRHAPLGVALVALVVAGASMAFWAGQTPKVSPWRAEALFAPPAHSVAVLAFDNLSGDPGQTYFSDGMSEQLIDALTRIEAIQVAGRISSFSFRGSRATAGEIGRKLDVSAVLEGSIRRSGARVTVTVQLINTLTGFNMWSSTYDRAPGDVVTIQNDIAAAVASALQVKLLGGEADKLALGGTANAAAYDFYLQGMRHEHTVRNVADHRAAVADFDRALALDPNFARAHVGRASALSNIATQGAMGSADAQHALFKSALVDADRAVALAPDWGQAHSSRAYVLAFGMMDPAAGEREMVQAQMLTPGAPTIEGNYANVELALGHVDVAVTAARRGAQLDPLSVNGWGQYGRTLFMARRYDEAAEALRHIAALTDHVPLIYDGLLGGVLILQGHADAARSLCAPAANLEEKEVLAIADQKLGHQADAEANLARLRADQGDAGAFSYAEIYAQWGRKAEAMTWLGTAARLHDPGVAEIAIDPMLDPVRGEAGFRQIRAQVEASNTR